MSPKQLSLLLLCVAGFCAAQTCLPTETDNGEGACLLQGFHEHAARIELVDDQSNDLDVHSTSQGRRRHKAETQEIVKIKKRLDKVEETVEALAKKKSAPTPAASPSAPPPSPPTPPRRSRHRRRRASPSPSRATPPPPSSKRSSSGGGASVTTGKVPVSLTDRWINAHNYWRCVHNTGPVTWDADIAAGAQQWVDEGHSGHSDCYNLPNPQGPTGENIAGGTRLSPEMASAMWHDENPERGPNCGGHCTAMLWKSANKLGCGLKKPKGGGMMSMTRVVCRYGGGTPLNKRLAANFGGSSSKRENVEFPDNSRAAECKKKWPPAKGHDHSPDSREPQKGGGRKSRGGLSGGGFPGWDDFGRRRKLFNSRRRW